MNTTSDTFTRGSSLPSALRSFVVARPTVLQALSDQPDGAVHQLVELRALEAGEAIPGDILNAAQCLFLEVSPENAGSIRRIEAVRQARPDLIVIAMISTPEFSLTRALIRQGVQDVISLPLRAEDVISILMDVGARIAALQTNLAPVVALASPTGGAGATTVITHLASALAKAAPAKSVCVIDLDVQFGDVGNYYGLTPRISVVDLLEAGDRMDNVMVREAGIDSGRGPRVIAAPAEMSPLEDISSARLQHLLRICRNEFDIVLLDLPSNWTNWVLATAVSCDHLLVLTEPTLHAIRRARRCLDLLESVGVTQSQASLIVNRVERRFMRDIDVSDVADTLHRPVLGAMPLESNQLSNAQDQGMLLQELTRRSHFEGAIDDLAHALLAKFPGFDQ